MGLVGCGKPLQKPVLPGFKPSTPEQLLLGRELNAKDLRALFKTLNSKGEFNSLSQLIGSFSDAELNAWGKFLGDWVYDDALSSKGLIRLLKKRVESRGFSHWKKNIEELGPELGLFVDDESLWNILPRLAQWWDPSFVERVLNPLKRSLNQKSSIEFKSKVDLDQLIAELAQLLKNDETRAKLLPVFQSMGEARWLIPLIDSARSWLQESGAKSFESIALDLSRKTGSLNQALHLAKTLDTPAEKILGVLKEGLRSNPDIVHALSMKWDPIFIRSLSKIVIRSLQNPEDGTQLDRSFWLSLPRKERNLPPTPEFVRLYSILYSGLQKIADPKRFEPQSDAGSYRLPLQLNALFLTRFLEEFARGSSQTLSPEIWESPVPFKEFRFSLIKEDSKKEIDESTRKDFEALGLVSTLSRLEKLVQEQDSGKQVYSLSFEGNPPTLAQGFSEALALAHSVKPLADVTPILVTLIDIVSNAQIEGGEFNVLSQVQGFLAQLTPQQWKFIKKILFEDLKIGQLEMEDRALLVSLFQSDPEVAEWVNEVLVHIQSIYVLDDNSPQPGIFGFYHSFLRRLGSDEISKMGTVLGPLSELGLFSESEEGDPVYPGFISLALNGDWVARSFRALGELDKAQAEMIRTKMNALFEQSPSGEKGADLVFDYFSSLAQKVQPEILSRVLRKAVQMEWGLETSELDWALGFFNRGGFLEFRGLLKGKNTGGPLLEAIGELRVLSQKKVIEDGMRLLAQIQNERMREVALTVLKMDQSGELTAFLDSAQLMFSKGEKK